MIAWAHGPRCLAVDAVAVEIARHVPRLAENRQLDPTALLAALQVMPTDPRRKNTESYRAVTPLIAATAGVNLGGEHTYNWRGSRTAPVLTSKGVGMMTFLWILLGILYVACWVYFGLSTFRKGHYWMFWIGFFLPFLWIIGALIGPTPRAAGMA